MLAADKDHYNTFNNEKEDSNSSEGFTIEEAIEHIGFGWTQIRIGLLSGCAWMADGMEIMVLSILGPVLLCEWRITTVEEALLTTVVFIGYLVGSPVFGNCADRFGRRKSLIFSAVWVLFYAVLSAASPNLQWLLFLRCLVGFGIGGGPQAITYYSEFLPVKTRGKLIILVQVLWALGGMFTAILALILMPFGWRYWLIATGAPVLLFVLFSVSMPTSPRFDLTCGKNKEARITLEQLAKSNRTSLPPGELLPGPIVKRGQIMDLVKPGLKLTSGLLVFLWFSSVFIYYGVILFTTEFIKAGDTCQPTITQEETMQCEAPCQTLTSSHYQDLIWTSAAELPGLFLTILLIDVIGRKLTIICCFFIFSLCCSLLMVCMSRVPMLVLLFTCRALAASASQVFYVYTPEIYPTEVRAFSVGICSAFGRLGAITTPYIAEVLLESSTSVALSVYTIIGLTAALVTYILPIETKGREMSQSAGNHPLKDYETRSTSMID